MKLATKVSLMRDAAIVKGRQPVAKRHQNVDRGRIERVLSSFSIVQPTVVDAVFALLDNTRPSWFSSPPANAVFSDGASTAHISHHISILQRSLKDRERKGHNSWLKALTGIGAVETCQLTEPGFFAPGHFMARSPGSAYRLNPDFVRVLKAHEDVFQDWLLDWSDEDATRQRLALQSIFAEMSSSSTTPARKALIQAVRDDYVFRFLGQYEVLYSSDVAGRQGSNRDEVELARAGLTLLPEDPIPDFVLWRPETGGIWIIEAVAQSNEVSQSKQLAIRSWLSRHGRVLDGVTTAYPTWKIAAKRQRRHKDLTPGSFLWVAEDPGRQFCVLPAVS